MGGKSNREVSINENVSFIFGITHTEPCGFLCILAQSYVRDPDVAMELFVTRQRLDTRVTGSDCSLSLPTVQKQKTSFCANLSTFFLRERHQRIGARNHPKMVPIAPPTAAMARRIVTQ